MEMQNLHLITQPQSAVDNPDEPEFIESQNFQGIGMGIATVFQKIKNDRVVCQADVEPYIQHFPMNINLSNFSEQPSEKGYDMALEGFAMLFKVTAGVLLVSALGVCIYNFVRSRKTAEVTTDMALSSVTMSKEISEVMELVRAAPGYQNRVQPMIQASAIPINATGRGRSFTLHGEVNFNDFAALFFDDSHHQHFTNAIASKVALGEFSSVTEHLMTPMADYLSDLAGRVKKLTGFIKDMPARLNAGQLEMVVKDIENLDTRTIRGTFLKRLNEVYDRNLPSPKGAFQSDSAELMEDRVNALKDHYDQTKDDKDFIKTHYAANAEKWKNGDVEGMLGRIPQICDAASKMGAAPSLSTGKNIVNECENLRRLIAPMEIPEMVDQSLKNTLESIRLDSIASVALFEMVINEQRQFTIYVQDILFQVAELAGAVSAFTKPTDPSKARKLLSEAADAVKVAKKVKV